ncbi:MAG TPA: hypothetical protein VJX94_14305, partial [Stellaceae bacterium]|nr:hypothetical protein [Stellaceae bacterium]
RRLCIVRVRRMKRADPGCPESPLAGLETCLQASGSARRVPRRRRRQLGDRTEIVNVTAPGP